jgi:hypothetical protein
MKYREVPRIKSETSTFTLSRDAKAKWLKALRSGKYKQARGTLFNGDGYCCLGVLCRTQGISNRKMRGWAFPESIGVNAFPDDLTFAIGYGDNLKWLSWLNDKARLTFAEIADLIETQVPCHD